jgi:hypothetical protein
LKTKVETVIDDHKKHAENLDSKQKIVGKSGATSHTLSSKEARSPRDEETPTRSKSPTKEEKKRLY